MGYAISEERVFALLISLWGGLIIGFVLSLVSDVKQIFVSIKNEHMC